MSEVKSGEGRFLWPLVHRVFDSIHLIMSLKEHGTENSRACLAGPPTILMEMCLLLDEDALLTVFFEHPD